MRVLDLFSGIGGFSIGLERAGMTTVAFCEIDPYCRKVLAKHWPGVPCYDDIRTLTAARLAADGIIAADVADAAGDGREPWWPQPIFAREAGWLAWSDQWLVEPDVGRVAHGVPARVDRLRSLGNAVVPQVVEVIGRAIMHNEGESHDQQQGEQECRNQCRR